MKRLSVLTVLFFVAVACSQRPDYSQVIAEFQRHKNEGDVESVLKMFAEEPSLHFGPLGSITGLNEVRGILEYDLALDTKLQFNGCVSTELDVACRVTESNRWLNLAGIDSITYDENRFTFTSDGRIESIASSLSANSAQSMGAAMADFGTWATENKPADYAELFSEDDRFVYSYENGEKVLALLRQWRSD